MYRYMKLLVPPFFFVVLSFSSIAQTPAFPSSVDILSGLKKLNVLGSVLYIAAHPDDENTRLLAYFSKEKLYRTGYLALTRGDGGQNLIGDEQGIELGMIRTQELLAARRIDGAEQFFSRAYDFGFSKRTEEALTLWDHEKVLSDAVWIIRKFQPDIIITRFPKDSRAGHGHHSASAVIAEEAFLAAGDPTRFPEQLEYVKPWKATRLLWNTFNFGTNNTQSEDQFKIDVGIFNPLIGKSYGELAAESRSQHKSQGFGVARQRGPALEYFATWQGAEPKKDLMDDVEVSWERVKGGAIIKKKIDSLVNNFSLYHPGESVKGLIELYKLIAVSDNDYWKAQKMKEVAQLIEACSGLWVEATTDTAFAVRGQSLKVNFFLNNRNGNVVFLKHIDLQGFDTTLNNQLLSNQNLIISKSVYVNESTPLSQPYWLQRPLKQGYFDVADQQLIGDADNKPSININFLLNVEGLDLLITKPLRQKYTDPVKGEIYQPVFVTTAERKNIKTISYDHIPRISYFAADSAKIVLHNVKIAHKRIGYIEGAGDKVVPALKRMGYEVDLLTERELKEQDLSPYSAIITGVRAYNVHDWLNNYYDKLMNYMQEGGNLIVQYNTSNQLGVLKAKIGPYPFTISRNRITEEDAEVKIIKPEHPLLNYPNKITAADFKGWIQERSIYHAQGWDSHYETIFAMHDEGEKDDEGSLIMTKYGKGHFVYTGLVFFRELPAGVEGAYKLFANIISLK